MRKIVEGIGADIAVEVRSYYESKGIEIELRGVGQNIDIWVLDEDKVQEALLAWRNFQVDFRGRGPRLPMTEIHRVEYEPLPVVSVGSTWSPVTIGTMTVSIGLSVLSFGPLRQDILGYLLISMYQSQFLSEVMSGEVWRIFTPTLLHGGFFHLVFNVIWLFQLGVLIEKTEGSLILLGQIVLIGSISNVAQYIVSGPMFMGLSGVIYGLFGYVWMMGLYKPMPEYRLNQHAVAMMMFFFVICMLGIVANVANTVHGVGLALGIFWGLKRALGIKGVFVLLKNRLKR